MKLNPYLYPGINKPRLTAAFIIKEVSNQFHISEECIIKRQRKLEFCIARILSVNLCRYFLKLSYAHIGKILDNRSREAIYSLHKTSLMYECLKWFHPIHEELIKTIKFKYIL